MKQWLFVVCFLLAGNSLGHAQDTGDGFFAQVVHRTIQSSQFHFIGAPIAGPAMASPMPRKADPAQNVKPLIKLGTYFGSCSVIGPCSMQVLSITTGISSEYSDDIVTIKLSFINHPVELQYVADQSGYDYSSMTGTVDGTGFMRLSFDETAPSVFEPARFIVTARPGNGPHPMPIVGQLEEFEGAPMRIAFRKKANP